GAPESARRVAARLLVSERRVVNPGELEIRRHLDAGQRDEANAWILHLPGQQERKLGADLIGDPVGTGTLAHQAVTATRSIAKTSIRSPILRSLNRSKPMPHSKPLLTSLASSLKRRSDPILPS